MKHLFTLLFLVLLTATAFAKPADTIEIKRGDLDMKALQTGSYSYVLFNKKTRESPAQRICLVKINVTQQVYHHKPAIVITQRWELDTLVHAAYSVFDAKDFSTIFHETWWKRLGYAMKFDFETKTATFTAAGIKGDVPDTVKAIATKDFNQSFDSYNINWHADLMVYQLLPYKAGRTFIINYYDPGLGKAEHVAYTVTGSEFVKNSKGENVECWVLNHNDPGDVYERFWIAKKTKEVLKEEDFSPKGYRYKLKIGVAGDGAN